MENIELSQTRRELEELIENQSTTMSKYQIDNFVLSDKMTDFKILKQILLELGTRYKGIDELEIDVEIEKLNLQKLEDKYNIHDDNIDKKIMSLEIKKQKMLIKNMEKTLSNYNYEIDIIEDNFKKIKNVYNDPQALLDDETGEEIYWVNKFIKEAQIDIMTGGRVGKGVLDAIMSLPENLQQVIITTAISQAASSNSFIALSEQAIIEKIKDNKNPKLMLNTIVGEKVD
jgi:hypothetical protein